MPFDPYMQKNALDWALGGAAATQPGSRFFVLCTGSPTSVSDSAGPFTPPRQSASWAAANSPQGSATLRGQASFTATAACTVLGWAMYDRSSGGTRLAYGTLSSSVGCASGDTIGFPAGNLKITMV